MRRFTTNTASIRGIAALASAAPTPIIAPPSFSSSFFTISQARGLMADKIRPGHIINLDKRMWRVISNARSQKGQNAASYHIKLSELGNASKTKEVSSGQGHDYTECRYERVKLLFSGFDDDDMACFVFPQHSTDAGREINIPGSKLPEVVQKWLAVAMPCDVTHVFAEENEAGGSEGEDIWTEVQIPTSYAYTVEKITMKGMYKMAHFKECDGDVSVPDTVQLEDKVKIVIRNDGTVGFNSKV